MVPLSLEGPGLAATSRPDPTPTWQVQVESQKQVHAEIRQLLGGVQGQPVLDDAQQELGEGRAQVLWEGAQEACGPAPRPALPGLPGFL